MNPVHSCGVSASARAADAWPHVRWDQPHTRPAMILNCTSMPSDQPETIRSAASMVLIRCGQVTHSTAAISCWI